MDINKKKYVNDFIKKENDESQSFNIVIEKINDIFLPILNKISSKLDGIVSFKLNIIGDYYLASNYNLFNPIHILIDYFVKEEDLEHSQKRAQKGNVGKLYSDAFNTKKHVVLTIEELCNVFFKELSISTKNISLFKRKNQIALNYLDYNFFVFFVNKDLFDDKEYEFKIKSKDFKLNFTETHENLLNKNKDTNGNFFDLIKFYKVIELELMLKNQLIFNASKIPYFYENLLYNIPNNLINNDLIYDNFLASFSYLINADIKEFVSADNYILVSDIYKLHSKPYITTIDINKILKQTKFFIDNIENIIPDIQN